MESGASYLADHEAVKNHGHGITPHALASFVEAFSDYSKGRVLGTGAEQYSSLNGQRFEQLDSAQVVDEAIDELADLVAYASMLSIKLLSIRNTLSEA